MEIISINEAIEIFQKEHDRIAIDCTRKQALWRAIKALSLHRDLIDRLYGDAIDNLQNQST